MKNNIDCNVSDISNVCNIKKQRKIFKQKKRIERIYKRIQIKLKNESSLSLWKMRFERNPDPIVLEEFFDILQNDYSKQNLENKNIISIKSDINQKFFEIAENEFLLYHNLIDKNI